MVRAGRQALCSALACLGVACAPFEYHHTIRWNAEEEIWQAEASQVKVRDAQTRFYDTTDKQRMLEAVVATFQDLGFQIGVLDETLGIVSGKKFTGTERPGDSTFNSDPTYYLYDEEAAVAIAQNPPPNSSPYLSARCSSLRPRIIYKTTISLSDVLRACGSGLVPGN